MRVQTIAAVVLPGVVATAIAVAYFRADRGPTSEEFRVYSALLKRLASDRHQQANEVALATTTLELSDQHYDTWIPAELRSNRTHPPSDFVAFCGWCGRDFVRKNLAVWRFNPSAAGTLGISVVEASESSPIPPIKRVVAVTRIGFNVWHNRAVLSYSADCRDSPEIFAVCVELGQAYLRKKNGSWELDHDDAFWF
jgi:hypothetical protein